MNPELFRLKPEQEIALIAYRDGIKDVSREDLESMFLSLVQQMYVKTNILADVLKRQA